MECPCKDCSRRGCGNYHDMCEPYNAWKTQVDKDRTRRQEENIREYNKRKRGL